MSALPKSIYVIRRNTRMIGFADNNQPYLIGFMQMTHAYLVKKNISVNPVVRIERTPFNPSDASRIEKDMNIEMNAHMSVVKHHMIDELNVFDESMEVTVMDMDAFMAIPLLAKTGVVIPYELMEDDDEAYTFKCQVITARLD